MNLTDKIADNAHYYRIILWDDGANWWGVVYPEESAEIYFQGSDSECDTEEIKLNKELNELRWKDKHPKNKVFSGMFDQEHNPIYIGDILISDSGTEVVVQLADKQSYGLPVFQNLKANQSYNNGSGQNWKITESNVVNNQPHHSHPLQRITYNLKGIIFTFQLQKGTLEVKHPLSPDSKEYSFSKENLISLEQKDSEYIYVNFATKGSPIQYFWVIKAESDVEVAIDLFDSELQHQDVIANHEFDISKHPFRKFYNDNGFYAETIEKGIVWLSDDELVEIKANPHYSFDEADKTHSIPTNVDYNENGFFEDFDSYQEIESEDYWNWIESRK